MELPRFIPIFPLPNVVLFPEVPLPLHIFEPRYCAMVRDALAGTGLIGMVLLRGDWEDEYHGAPETYRTGCVGRIVETTQLPDGKFNIVLAGSGVHHRERAARTGVPAGHRGGREAAATRRFRSGSAPARQMIERYVGRSGDDVAHELLGDARLDDRTLVNFFAFWLDFGAVEKQCLLEAAGLERAQRLLEVLEFHLYAGPAVPNEVGMRRMH
jgi:Lon protease-like protein